MTSSLRDALRLSGALDQFQPVAPEPRSGRSDPRTPKRGDQRGDPRGDRGARTGKPARPPARPGAGAHAQRRPPAKAVDAKAGDIDLAKAYALRAQSEQRERERRVAAEREQAERRRLQRQQVLDLLEGRTLNRDDAETVRNFEYGGKIRRVYVTDEQLLEVNDGRLGVIQMRGRYLLVERGLALEIAAVDASAVAVLVDPDEAGAEPQPADPVAAAGASPQ
jgi:uncharacterized protein YaiL (DUF2058 family)